MWMRSLTFVVSFLGGLGGRLHLNFSLRELDGSTRSTPSAFVRCVEEGSEVVVGPTLTPQTESAMLLANVYGTFCETPTHQKVVVWSVFSIQY
jgi:hypothetical protein